MATTRLPRNPVADGDDVAWTDIHPDGTETQAFGRVWSPAAPLAGMSAWWVIEDRPDGEAGAGPPVLVCRSSRRHLAGRAFQVRRRSITGGMEWRSMWDPKGGRFVDVGEWFRETEPRSRFARTFSPSSHARFRKRADNVALALFQSVCDRVERGENVDLSVSAEDAANVADLAHAEDTQ